MTPPIRLFWGFDTQPQQAELLACQQRLAGPDSGPGVPAVNLHLTLLFLGSVPLGTLEALIQLTNSTLARLPLSQMALTLDHSGLFPRAKAGWVGPSQVPEMLQRLESSLRAAVSEAGWPLDPRPYRPHVTLFRKARALASADIPSITLNLEQLHLYESVSTPLGVRYHPRASWSLIQHHRQARGEA